MEGIQIYIAKDSGFYARQFIERIFEVAKNLETFPELGRKVPEAEDREDIRELIFQGYRIIYLHQGEHVYIMMSSRFWEPDKLIVFILKIFCFQIIQL